MASLALQNEAGEVAKQLFGSRKAARVDFTRHLLDTYDRAQDKDFLVIHNPGGWGGLSTTSWFLAHESDRPAPKQ